MAAERETPLAQWTKTRASGSASAPEINSRAVPTTDMSGANRESDSRITQ